MNTNKLLIITWIVLAFVIGVGTGYLLGVRGFGQPNPQFGGQQMPPPNRETGGQQGQNWQGLPQGGSQQPPVQSQSQQGLPNQGGPAQPR